MQDINNTINHLPRHPGRSWTDAVCLSVHKRLIGITMGIGVRCLSTTNEQFYSYASDLGMT